MSDIQEQNKGLIRWAYAWIIIMFAVNTFYVGYMITSINGFEDYSVTEAMGVYYSLGSTLDTNIKSINETVNDISANDISNTRGGLSGLVLDLVDGILNFRKFISFMVNFVLLGGVFVGWSIFRGDFIGNVFIRLMVTGFFVIGNAIFIVLMYKFVFNKGKE